MSDDGTNQPPTGPSQRSHPPNDASDLLRRAKSGDFDAFQELIRDLQPRVFGLCMKILQKVHDAEDATQQTFVSMIEHLDQFREDSSLATWVLRIASNHALKILKKRSKAGNVTSTFADGDRYDNIPHPEFIAPWSEPADAIAMRREVREELDAALSDLDEKYRVVFVLRDIEGLSVREAAHTLEITESTVKVRLLRARLALRERLTRMLGDPEQSMIPDHRH
jgi:RNA polymerase sigma-70 factor (ECF subfamily)